MKRDRLALVRTHSAYGTALSPAYQQYPVVVFSPASRRDECTSQVEDLASHGYIVVGLDHPPGTEADWFLNYATDETFARSLERVNRRLRLWVDDTRFVLDDLERRNRDDPSCMLADRLDLTQVGIFGFSFGGAVAAETSRLDERIGAVANLDGLLFGQSASGGVACPSLFLSDDTTIPAPEIRRDLPPERARAFDVQDQCVENIQSSITRHGGHFVVVRMTRHPNFADDALSSPWTRRMGLGPADPYQVTATVRNCLRLFFDQHLNPSDARRGPSFHEYAMACPELDVRASRPVWTIDSR